MQYVTLGRTGLRVSRLGFGAMRLLTGPDGRYDLEASARLMRRAFDLGVNFVDSQYHYCDDLSETAVGMAVAGRRDSIVIQTKACYYDRPKYRPGETHRTRLEETLRRLGTEYVDVYLMHSLHANRWEKFGAEWIDAACKAREQGLVRFLGFSSHDTPENVKRFIDTGPFDVVLMQYNLLDQRYEGAFAYARQKGLGTTVMGPVGGGRLAEPSEALHAAAPETIKTSADLAMRFVLSNADIDCAFSGMRSEAEVEENCRVASDRTPLGPQERGRILELLREKKRLADLYCSGCNYCSPCPHGVAISAIFGAMALHKVWGLTEAARKRYARLSMDSESARPATACVECGECESKCPQNIPIRQRLKEAHEALKGGSGRDEG